MRKEVQKKKEDQKPVSNLFNSFFSKIKDFFSERWLSITVTLCSMIILTILSSIIFKQEDS
jgi:hypothetical protein